MPYDRKHFFDVVRKDLFRGNLTQSQVDGMNYLLEVCLVVALAAGATPATGAKSQVITAQTTRKGISVSYQSPATP